MKHPNFFIVGAPKCGTTSVAAWLTDHPSIYMSDPKEPDYFNDDINTPGKIGRDAYLRLFRLASETYKAVGEASTGYLRSRSAVPRILSSYPEAKFIVCIRNPADMALSWHGEALNSGWESEKDFEVAWRLQDQRRAGLAVPTLCPDPGNLIYRDVCSLGYQLERLLGLVPRERVFVLVLDDLKNLADRRYKELLEFLNVPDDGRDVFPVYNAGKRIPRLLAVSSRLVEASKAALGLRFGFGLMTSLRSRKFARREHQISTEMRVELIETFKPEVEKLESLLGRTFPTWKAIEDSGVKFGEET